MTCPGTRKSETNRVTSSVQICQDVYETYLEISHVHVHVCILGKLPLGSRNGKARSGGPLRTGAHKASSVCR